MREDGIASGKAASVGRAFGPRAKKMHAAMGGADMAAELLLPLCCPITKVRYFCTAIFSSPSEGRICALCLQLVCRRTWPLAGTACGNPTDLLAILWRFESRH